MNKFLKVFLVASAILFPLALIGGAYVATSSHEDEENIDLTPVPKVETTVFSDTIIADYTIGKSNFVDNYDDTPIVEGVPYRMFIVSVINMDEYNKAVKDMEETTSTDSTRTVDISDYIRRSAEVYSDQITTKDTKETAQIVDYSSENQEIIEVICTESRFTVTLSDLKPETNYRVVIEFYYVDGLASRGYNIHHTLKDGTKDVKTTKAQ